MQSLTPREKILLDYIILDNTKSIVELSEKLQVSTNTIRSDFKSLEDKGFVITVRGGALPAYYPEVLQRMNENFDVKLKIAQKAAELIEDNDTIMISCGTTCSLVARFLYGKRNVTIITNSTLLLPYARTNPNINFILIGGEFLPQEDATVGISVMQELDNYYPRLAIVGSDNFSFESGITTTSSMVTDIISKMIQQAQTTILVVESHKYGKARFIKICSMSEIDIIVTDSNLNKDSLGLFKEEDIKVILAE